MQSARPRKRNVGFRQVNFNSTLQSIIPLDWQNFAEFIRNFADATWLNQKSQIRGSCIQCRDPLRWSCAFASLLHDACRPSLISKLAVLAFAVPVSFNFWVIRGEKKLFFFYILICYGDIRVYTFIVKDVLFPFFTTTECGELNYITPEIGLTLTLLDVFKILTPISIC